MHNYFDDLTKFFFDMYLAKFLNTLEQNHYFRVSRYIIHISSNSSS